MGSTYFAISDSPAFEENLRVRTEETLWVRRKCVTLVNAGKTYADALDPRLRRPAPAGMPDGLANLTAPLLEALARPHEGEGDPWENADTRFAGVLERLSGMGGAPADAGEEPDEPDDLDGPLSAAIGGPLLHTLSTVLRSVGTARERLGQRVSDTLTERLQDFLANDLEAAELAAEAYSRKVKECDAARASFLSVSVRASEAERRWAADQLEDSKHALEAARTGLVLALCAVDGKRRYVMVEVVKEAVAALMEFFQSGLGSLMELAPVLSTIDEYVAGAKEQAERKMQAQTQQLSEFWERLNSQERVQAGAAPAAPEGPHRAADAAQPAQPAAEGQQPAEGGGAAPEAAEGALASPAPAAAPGRASVSPLPNTGRSSDLSIRQSLQRAASNTSVLGHDVIHQGYLAKYSGRRGQWARQFFVLDGHGALAFHSGHSDAVQMLSRQAHIRDRASAATATTASKPRQPSLPGGPPTAGEAGADSGPKSEGGADSGPKSEAGAEDGAAEPAGEAADPPPHVAGDGGAAGPAEAPPAEAGGEEAGAAQGECQVEAGSAGGGAAGDGAEGEGAAAAPHSASPPDSGILLPIAQDAMHSVGGLVRGLGSLLGRGRSASADKPQKPGSGGAGDDMVMDLMVCAIKMGCDPKNFWIRDLPFCFRIISPTQVMTLQAESEEERQRWVGALQGVIAELLTASAKRRAAPSPPQPARQQPLADEPAGQPEAAPEAPPEEGSEQDVMTLLECVPGNDRCADCGALSPDWASINLGLLLCQQCAGAHRSLGTHISKVRSVLLDGDSWSAPLVSLFQASGNEAMNAVLQAELAGAASGEAYVVTAGMSATDRLEAIQAKYLHRKHVATSFVEEAKQEGRLREAALRESVVAVLRLVAAGADVRAASEDWEDEGETALHAACTRGDEGLGVVVALCLNGGDVAARSSSGVAPLDVATTADGEHGELTAFLQAELDKP